MPRAREHLPPAITILALQRRQRQSGGEVLACLIRERARKLQRATRWRPGLGWTGRPENGKWQIGLKWDETTAYWIGYFFPFLLALLGKLVTEYRRSSEWHVQRKEQMEMRVEIQEEHP